MISNFCPYCLIPNPHGSLKCVSCGGFFDEFDPNHLSPGTLLRQGKYQIGKTLGQGGFAITYQAVISTNIPANISTNISTNIIAIKELWPDRAGRQDSKVRWPHTIPPNERRSQIDKFKEEAKKLVDLVKLRHPSIVKVYDYFEENNTAYIVMEFINGKTLYQILRAEGPLSEDRIKKYFLQLAEALIVIHQGSILHRDIKPDNIMINEHDRAVLIDFGSAREFTPGRSKNMTRILTPGYAPPEQYSYRANRYPSADIYSLCASMYELLTGQLPSEALDRRTSKVSTSSGTDSLIPPRQLAPQISPLMEKIILTGMELKADERFESAVHLIDALKGNYMSPLFIKARELVKKGKLIEAAQLYQDCLKIEPDNQQAAVEYALILIHLNNPQAESAIHHAISLQSNNGRLYGALGLLYCRQSNWQAAIKSLQQAIKSVPHESWIWANLGWAIAKSGNLQNSLIAVNKAIEIDKKNNLPSQFAMSLKAWIVSQQEQWNSAISLAKQTILQLQQANFPNSSQDTTRLQAWIYPCLLVALNRMPNKSVIELNELQKYLQEYINQFTDTAFAYGFRGYLQALNGQWANAIDDFNLGINPEINQVKVPPFWMLLDLGISYEYMQDFPAAIKIYQFCYQLESEDCFVLFRLGTTLSQQAQRLDKQELFLEARSYLELAVQLKPDYAEAYHNLAWVLHHIRNSHGLIDNPAQILATYRQASQLYEQQNKPVLAQQIRQAFQDLGIQL